MVIVYKSGICGCVYVQTGMTRIEMIDGYAHAYKFGPDPSRVVPLSHVLRVIDAPGKADIVVRDECEEHKNV